MKHDYAKLAEECASALTRYRSLEASGEDTAYVPSERTLDLFLRAAAALAQAGELEEVVIAVCDEIECQRRLDGEGHGSETCRHRDSDPEAWCAACLARRALSPAEPGRETER